MASPGNPNQPSPPPTPPPHFDMAKFFMSAASPSQPEAHISYPPPPPSSSSYPPPTLGPGHGHFPYSIPQASSSPFSHPEHHLISQRSLSYPAPLLQPPNPNAGAHLMALLSSLPQPSMGPSELPVPSSGSAPGVPARMPSSKVPRGRHLVGDSVVYDVDVRLAGEVQPQLEVTPITKYASDPQLVLGRQIAVKQGNMRLLNINTASRSLLRGHTQTPLSLDGNGHVGGDKRVKHYSNFHRILLVGEGDFSFAACLARRFGSAVNMVATSLDSRATLWMSYTTSAIDNLETIEGFGGTVLHEVDAHTMSKHPILKQKSFHRIVYNFPHAGFCGPEASFFQIELHKDLVRGFLKNAKTMLTDDGEIHVTHKTAHPYSKWEIEKLAEEQGLLLVEEVRFSVGDYVGYVNRRGSGAKCNGTFPIGEASTYKISKNGHGMLCANALLNLSLANLV